MTQGKDREKTSGLKQIFSDLSFPQVAAGALAAVTSMLLASNVGIAGTVIGVAVSSVVSAVASQVYKQFILASAEKVKDLAPVGLIHHGAGLHGHDGEEGSVVPRDADVPAEWAAAPGGRAYGPNPYDVRRSAMPAPYAQTSRATQAPAAAWYRSSGVSMGDEYARSAILQARAARERKAKIHRNTLIVAVVSAVIAVAVCAVMINVVTQGKGLGPQMPTATYMQQWSASSSQQDAESADSEDGGKDASKDKDKAGSKKNASSSTNKNQGSKKPNSGSSSAGGSSSGSSDNSSDTQPSQDSSSSDTADDGSSETDPGSQGGQEDQQSSDAGNASSNSKPTGTATSKPTGTTGSKANAR